MFIRQNRQKYQKYQKNPIYIKNIDIFDIFKNVMIFSNPAA